MAQLSRSSTKGGEPVIPNPYGNNAALLKSLKSKNEHENLLDLGKVCVDLPCEPIAYINVTSRPRSLLLKTKAWILKRRKKSR
jgi:hypothetical protein